MLDSCWKFIRLCPRRSKKAVDEVFQFKEDFVDVLAEYFGVWGLIVFDYPGWTCLITALFCGLTMIGFIPGIAHWIDGAENCYSLPVSESKTVQALHDKLFIEELTRPSFAVVTSNPPGRNIWTWDDINAAYEIDQIIRGKLVDPIGGRLVGIPALPKYYPNGLDNVTTADTTPKKDPQTIETANTKAILTFEDLCMNDPVTTCKVQSIFEMGVYDIKSLLAPGSPPELYVMDEITYNTQKKGYSPGLLLGGMKTKKCLRDLPTALLLSLYSEDELMNSSTPGFSKAAMECVTEAYGFNFIYELKDAPQYVEREMAWEKAFFDILRDNKFHGNLTVAVNAFRSRDDDLSASTAESADIIYVVFTFILLVVYTTFINFNCDQFRSKAISSLVGSLSTLMGVMSGLGLPSMLGVSFCPTSLVTPFLVLGVGADDIFVIVSSYALAYGEDGARARCAVTLRGCGVSVVMTTITNVMAFAIGCQSAYLSVRNFCIFTLSGLFFSLLYELTVFYAAMCYDARREYACKAFYINLPAEERQGIGKVEETVSTFHLAMVLVKTECQQIRHLQAKPYKRRAKKEEDKQQAASKGRVCPPFSQFPIAIVRFFVRMWRSFENSGMHWHVPYGAIVRPDQQTNNNTQPTDSKPSSTQPTAASSPISTANNIVPPENSNLLDVTHLMSPSHLEDVRLGDSPRLTHHGGKGAAVAKRFILNAKLLHPCYEREPNGNVGSTWRKGFIRWYCAFLLHPVVKLLVVLFFSATFSAAIYGIFHLKQGLALEALCPDGSYLKMYDMLWAKYFPDYDLPVDVFFYGNSSWWDPRTLNAVSVFAHSMRSRPETRFLNEPLTLMAQDPELSSSLTSGNKDEFLKTLYDAVNIPSSKYKQFENDFVWDGHELVAWRAMLLPAATTSSQQRAAWMEMVRSLSHAALEQPENETIVPISVTTYNYMMIFYESDMSIVENVVAAMSTAALVMVVVAFILIPEILSGILVLVMMVQIDFTIMGFMYYWDVPLNMVSMIILVISIGFSVDYTAHVCYNFVNCIGRTRNQRITETIVLVGTPLFHGAMANLVGVILLGWSTSYILRIFFKMMLLVVVFGISHGMILLPVLLSWFGTMSGAELVSEDDVPYVTDLDDLAHVPEVPYRPKRPPAVIEFQRRQNQVSALEIVERNISVAYEDEEADSDTNESPKPRISSFSSPEYADSFVPKTKKMLKNISSKWNVFG